METKGDILASIREDFPQAYPGETGRPVWEAEISQAGCSLESEGQGDGVQPQPLLNGFYLLSPSPTAEPQEPSS